MNTRPHRYGGNRGELIVVLDCSDLERSADFWTAALGYVRWGKPEGNYLSLVPADGDGIELLLQLVSDPKTAKSRVHLDLRARDFESELERLEKLGATRLSFDPVVEDGWAWHVLSDPDGNEFCVLRPPPDYFD